MLARVVGAYCRGLEGDDEGFEAAWKCIVATLVRVTAALWLIDAQLGHRPVSRLLPEAVARRRPKPPQTHDERLAQVVTAGGSRAVEAALELFERREPASFSDAVKLVSSRGVPGPAAFDAMADAWETIRSSGTSPGTDVSRCTDPREQRTSASASAFRTNEDASH